MKKTIAILLSLVLLLGLVPLSALAATDEPYTEIACPICGSNTYDPYGDGGYVQKEPTCTEPGVLVLGYCSTEGREITHPIAALGHIGDSGVVIKQPTCTEPGQIMHHCRRMLTNTSVTGPDGDFVSGQCPATWYVDIPPLEHDWGEWVRTREPTPTQKGEEKRECLRSDAEEVREIDYVPPTMDGVSFVKYVDFHPGNGSFYVKGEHIHYTLTLVYTGEGSSTPFTNVRFDDPLIAGDIIEPTNFPNVYHYQYTVSNEDVERGYIENTATAYFTFPGETAERSIVSNTVTVPTGKGDQQNADDISVQKLIISNPRNGEFYVEGETVRFAVEVYIPGDSGIASAVLWDAHNNDPLGTWDHPGSSGKTFEYDYVITAGDVEAGSISNVAWLEWVTFEGREGSLYSNYVYAATGIDENPGNGMPTIRKVETSTPANGQFYVPGETASFDIIITNPSDGKYLDKLCVYDFYYRGYNLGGVQSSVLTPSRLMPGESYVASFDVPIELMTAEEGFLENRAVVYFFWGEDGGLIEPEPVSCFVPAGFEEREHTPYFVKKVISTPANGLFYTPGELVTYELSLSNPGKETFTDIKVHDGDFVGAAAPLAPGESCKFIYSVAITEAEAMAGWKDNVASVDFIHEKSGSFTQWSNMVSVPTGFDWGFGVITDMEVTKTETSTPKNGTYYTLGEAITYTITVANTGETDFDEVIVYDALVPGSGEIASIELFYAGSTRSYSFEHVVNQLDVDAGYVANSASAAAYSIAGTNFYLSNVVISDTDGVPDDFPHVPGTGITPPGSFDGPGSLAGGEGDNCDCTLVQHSDGSWVYEQTYCHIHMGTKKAVADILSAGFDDNLIAMAKELWTADIEELYEELMNHADSLAKGTLMNHRNSFFAMVDNKEAALRAIYPGDAETVGTQVLQLLEDQVNALCYLLHKAPSQRNDRETEHTAASDVTAEDGCFVFLEHLDSGNILRRYALCEEHMPLAVNSNKVLDAMSPRRAWPSIQRLWEMELQSSFLTLLDGLPEEQATAVASYYRSAKAFEDAYISLLEAMYPDQPDVTGETISIYLRALVMETDSLLATTGIELGGKNLTGGFRTK